LPSIVLRWRHRKEDVEKPITWPRWQVFLELVSFSKITVQSKGTPEKLQVVDITQSSANDRCLLLTN
jgi:hypothetical protein